MLKQGTTGGLLMAALLAGLSACGGEQTAATAPVAATPAAPVTSTATADTAPDQPQLKSYTEFLKAISADEMEGRGPGTAGEKRTIEYLTTQLKQLGLKPGPDGSYTQAVPMAEITGEVKTPLRFTSEAGELAPAHADDYVATSHRLDPENGVAEAEMVFVGFGVVAPEYGWNDYAGIDVKGKVVVTLINDPGFASGDESLFRGRTMTYYGRWSYKFEEAVRQGAAGALIIHDDAGASYGWEVVKNSWSGPEYVLPAAPDSTPPLAVQGWLTGATAEKLLAQSGLDLKTLRAAADKPGFKAQPLKSKVSVAVSNKVRMADSFNVIGVIEGSERPSELLMYIAHWDHLGRSFGLPDGIFNGAIDNGTGVAGLLEIARAMKAGPAPKRSVAFLFVTLEESGLLGSRFYTQNPLYPLKDTVAVINMDAMHVIGPTRDMIVIGRGNSQLEDLLETELKNAGRVLRAEPTPENGFYYRSDHFNFAKAGVPALYPKTGIDHLEKGAAHGQAVIDDYNKSRYHKPGDQFDPAWDLSGMIADLKVIQAVGAGLANGSEWPNWYENTEFRASRDAMRAP